MGYINIQLDEKEAEWLLNALNFVSNKFLENQTCDQIISKLYEEKIIWGR